MKSPIELQQKIGQQVKELRHLNHWSQEEIAHRLGMSRNAYGDIERGQSDISLSRLTEIASLFNVEIGYLFGTHDKTVFVQFNPMDSEINLKGAVATQQGITVIDKNSTWHIHLGEESELRHELEKTKLLLSEREKEVTLLKEQIQDLREFLKKASESAFT